MRKYIADLHVHTLLSPCAEVEMTPRLIVMYAAALGINIIAITDHNASGNVKAAIEAASQHDITIIPGMELQTREEIHVLCLFPTLEALEDWQKIVDAKLPDLKNKETLFGAQFVVDAQDELVRIEDRLLLVSTDISIEDAVAQVGQCGGICIAAHVDKSAFSVISQLGFIPPGLTFAALEVSKYTSHQNGLMLSGTQTYPMIVSSDAHRLDDLAGPKTWFYLENPTFSEIIKAFKGEDERKVVVEPLK